MKCIFENCNAHATYGFPHNFNLLDLNKYEYQNCKYCFKHKLNGMIYLIKHKNCHIKNCQKRPYYGYLWQTEKYCKDHKLSDMIYVYKRKLCASVGCTTTPHYGFKNQKMQYCVIHKFPNMIYLNKYQKCAVLNCEKRSRQFKNIGKKYCGEHNKLLYK